MAKAKRSSNSATNGKTNNRATYRPVNKFSGPSFELEPKNENQKKFIEDINNEGKKIIFGVGAAGTGKSFLALGCGLKKLLNEEFDKLILIREIIPAGEPIGYLKGSLEEKIAPALEHLFELSNNLISEYQLEQLYAEERIQMKSISYLRGANFDNAFVLVDESANLTAKVFKLILTRLGENSKICFIGDEDQCDLRGNQKSGLPEVLERFEKKSWIGITHFNISDCVRSGFVKEILESYDQISDEEIRQRIEKKKREKK